MPEPTYRIAQLRPLHRRVFRALRLTLSLWIKPWDRGDHDCYEGLRSIKLAWEVAWGIWGNWQEGPAVWERVEEI